MRATLSDAGIPQAAASYDAWGVPETPMIGSFGFTGELQQGSDVWLRARWYGAGRGSFGSRDPLPSIRSLSPYTYASDEPINRVDASGLRDYKYVANGSPSESQVVASKLKSLYPIAPGYNSLSPSPLDDLLWEQTVNASIAAGQIVPHAGAVLLHYLMGSGSEYQIDFHALKNDAPKSFRRATDLEFDSVLDFLKGSPPSLGTHTISSTDATRRIRGQDGVPYPFILEEGVPISQKESPDWFLATNDFALWGEGTVEVSNCAGADAFYRVSLQFHFFDLYDWERNPGEPVGVGINVGTLKITDENMRHFYLVGYAKYFYMREREPVTIIREYRKIGSNIVPFIGISGGGGGTGGAK